MPSEQPPGAIWLKKNWEDLREVNFLWVAANGDRLLAHGPELDVVMNDVIGKGLVEEAVYALVDFAEVLK